MISPKDIWTRLVREAKRKRRQNPVRCCRNMLLVFKETSTSNYERHSKKGYSCCNNSSHNNIATDAISAQCSRRANYFSPAQDARILCPWWKYGAPRGNPLSTLYAFGFLTLDPFRHSEGSITSYQFLFSPDLHDGINMNRIAEAQ